MTGGTIMKNRFLLAGTVLITLVCIILGSILFYYLVQDEEEASLIVDEVYFIGRDSSSDLMTIEVDVWVTNEGKADADKVSVNTFAVETDSNLARANATVQIEGLKAKSSAKTKLSMEVPLNETYRIEVLVFNEGKLTITGSGILDLTKAGYPRDYSTDRNLDEEKDEEKSSNMEDSLCAVTGIIGMGILVLVIVVLVTISTKSDEEKKEEPERKVSRLRMPEKGVESSMIADQQDRPKEPSGNIVKRAPEAVSEDGRDHQRMPRSFE